MRARLRHLAAVLVAVAAAGGSVAAGPAAAAAGDPRAPERLDAAGWEFQPDPNDVGMRADWERGRAPERWTPVRLPHVFNADPRPELFGGTVGWYRLRFEKPEDLDEAAIRFEQVRRVARAWLNGRHIGTNTQPYAPFEFDLEGLKEGTNELLVRVDHRKGEQPREGWWNWGGIVRPTYLVPRGDARLRDLGLMTRFSCRPRCRASVLVDGWVENRTDREIRPSVNVRLVSPAGDVTRRRLDLSPLPAGGERRVRFRARIGTDYVLWSPDNPRLYDARVETRVGDEITQLDERRIGLRRTTVRRGRLELNGRPLHLHGASIHEDVMGRGAAMTDADVEEIVRELQAVGANVTRSHYVLDERLLRRFDEEGILVWSQAPIYHADVQLKSPRGRRVALETLRRSVLAARNHPSVILHSLANELKPKLERLPGSRRYIRGGARIVRDLDPEIPLALDLLSFARIPRQDVYDVVDVLGVNSYWGWYNGPPRFSTRAFRGLVPFLRGMRAKYPDHALVMSEFGAESTFSGSARIKETFEFQRAYVKRTLDVVDRLGILDGAIYWTLREFAVKPYWQGGVDRPPEERDSIHNKGLLFYDGDRKLAWATFRAWALRQPQYQDERRPSPGAP